MGLQVRDHATHGNRGLADPIGVEPVSAKGVGHRHPLGVGALQPFSIEPAHHREAAQERQAVADPFLFAESNHLDGERQFGEAFLADQNLDHRQPEQDAEHAVILAAVGHGIEVRADQEHRPVGIRPADPPDDVSRRVLADPHAVGLHPARQPQTGRLERGGQKRPGDSPWLLGEPRQLVAPAEYHGGGRFDQIFRCLDMIFHRDSIGCRRSRLPSRLDSCPD